MKRPNGLMTFVFAGLALVATAACDNTAAGAKKDAEIAAEDAKRASEKAAEATADAARDASDATKRAGEAVAESTADATKDANGGRQRRSDHDLGEERVDGRQVCGRIEDRR